jgi:hypothetical protein
VDKRDKFALLFTQLAFKTQVQKKLRLQGGKEVPQSLFEIKEPTIKGLEAIDDVIGEKK